MTADEIEEMALWLCDIEHGGHCILISQATLLFNHAGVAELMIQQRREVT